MAEISVVVSNHSKRNSFFSVPGVIQIAAYMNAAYMNAACWRKSHSVAVNMTTMQLPCFYLCLEFLFLTSNCSVHSDQTQ